MFWEKKTPDSIGLELSRQLRDSILNFNPPSIEGVESERVSIESMILKYFGCRLALQAMSTTDEKENRMREICDVFDSHCCRFLPDSPSFNDLLDKRGERYFQLFKSHNEQIRSDGNWEGFLKGLRLRFEQFCLGGGDKNGPLILSSFSNSMMPLMGLAGECWSESFVKTIEYIDTRQS